jgi:hypothetical protein
MKKASFEDIGLMRPNGIVLLLAGIGLFVFGLQYDPTFATGQEPLYGLASDRMFNIGMVTEKLVMLISGSTLSLMGSVMLQAAGIRRDIRHAATIDRDPSQPDAE